MWMSIHSNKCKLYIITSIFNAPAKCAIHFLTLISYTLKIKQLTNNYDFNYYSIYAMPFIDKLHSRDSVIIMHDPV